MCELDRMKHFTGQGLGGGSDQMFDIDTHRNIGECNQRVVLTVGQIELQGGVITQLRFAKAVANDVDLVWGFIQLGAENAPQRTVRCDKAVAQIGFDEALSARMFGIIQPIIAQRFLAQIDPSHVNGTACEHDPLHQGNKVGGSLTR